MYRIYPYIWLKFMVHVGKHTKNHGSCGTARVFGRSNVSMGFTSGGTWSIHPRSLTVRPWKMIVQRLRRLRSGITVRFLGDKLLNFRELYFHTEEISATLYPTLKNRNFGTWNSQRSKLTYSNPFLPAKKKENIFILSTNKLSQLGFYLENISPENLTPWTITGSTAKPNDENPSYQQIASNLENHSILVRWLTTIVSKFPIPGVEHPYSTWPFYGLLKKRVINLLNERWSSL